MTRSTRTLLLLALPLAAVVGACTEDLDTGSTCPLLCPGQDVAFLDTVFDPAYSFDTTLYGFPLQGLDASMLLANRPDTLDVRVVIRFDSLIRAYIPFGADTAEPISHVDSAFLSFRASVGELPLPARVTIEAYDVFDPSVADSATTDLLPHFAPSRLIGGVSFLGANHVDSVRVKIPLDSAYLRALLADSTHRLHVGLRIVSQDPVEMLITPYLPNGDGPLLDYQISTDSLVDPVTSLRPSSATPTTPGLVAGDLVDFQVVALAPDYTMPGRFVVGGLPGARTYIRFDLPTWLTDSVGVLRARLELTQDPIYGAASTDTFTLLPHLVVAGHEVTDLRRATTLLTGAGSFTNIPTMLPSDSGVVSIEMNQLVRLWVTQNGVKPLPSAIVLRSNNEGTSPMAVRFFSPSAADVSLRPRLRISYTPGAQFGRP